MSSSFKISGKKIQATQTGQYSFTQRPGGWVIAESTGDGQPPQRVRMMFWQNKNRFTASSRGVLWFGEVSKDRQALASSAKSSDSDLVAQFPGKVRRILVKLGVGVAEGDPLLLVEAMKMEFAIRAPFSGTVTSIHVKEGQQLSPGDRFLDLQEDLKSGKETPDAS